MRSVLRRFTVVPALLFACAGVAVLAAGASGATPVATLGAITPASASAPASAVVSAAAGANGQSSGVIQGAQIGAGGATSPVALSSAAAGSGCWTGTIWEKGYNLLGGTVWQYNQQINWCSNGHTITSRQPANDYGDNTGLGWNWDTSYSKFTNSGGAGSSFWTHWNQGHFCLGAYFACVQNSYPWIQTSVYADSSNIYWSVG